MQLFPEIVLDSLAQNDDPVGMADSRFLSLHNVRRGKPSPFLPHMIQAVDRNDDILAAQLRKPAENTRAFRMEMHQVIRAKGRPHCGDRGGGHGRQPPFVEGPHVFKPHAFDENSLKKIIRNKAFLTFLVLDKEKIGGYFFLRCFVNGKCFKGYIVDHSYKGRGLAKLEGMALNKVNEILRLRMFGSISPHNPASMAAAKAVNEIRIIETLENGDYYIEFLPKSVAEERCV